MLATKVNKKLC